MNPKFQKAKQARITDCSTKARLDERMRPAINARRRASPKTKIGVKEM
jgi:hypothetical protein